MKLYQLLVSATALAGAALAQTAATGPKIPLVNMQDAITATTDGKTAEKQLDDEFAPRKIRSSDAQEKGGLPTRQAQLNRRRP